MARVLILSLVFPPDGVSTAQLMGELAEDLKRGGHEVSVVTTEPHYNCDAVARQEQPLRMRWRGLLYQSEFHGIDVLHTAIPAGRGGLARRFRGWLQFHALGFIVALFSVTGPEVIFVPSPLLSVGVVGWLVGALRGGRLVYNVQELYPELAIQLGQLRNRVAIRMLRALERFVYRRAAAITAITPGMCGKVAATAGSPEKVHFIPNFVDVEDLVPLPKENEFSREHGLQEAFVVSYAGNMGYAQGLETLLAAAALLRGDADMRVLLVGDGVLRPRLQARVGAEGLHNVVLLGHQPYARMPHIYAASDVSLVAMLGGVAESALPSKVLRIMACGRPVLAMCDPASELAEMVRKAGAGVVVPPGDPAGLAAAITALASRPQACRAMGDAGREYVVSSFSRGAVMARYSTLLSAVAATSRAARRHGRSCPAESAGASGLRAS